MPSAQSMPFTASFSAAAPSPSTRRVRARAAEAAAVAVNAEARAPLAAEEEGDGGFRRSGPVKAGALFGHLDEERRRLPALAESVVVTLRAPQDFRRADGIDVAERTAAEGGE